MFVTELITKHPSSVQPDGTLETGPRKMQAGGGKVLFVWASPKTAHAVARGLEQYGFKVLAVHL
jgi:hypothetical protein